VPVAVAYARRTVSPTQCKNAKKLANGATSDPCKTFADLQGERVGAAHVLRGCGTIADRVKGAGRLRNKDCVAVPLSGATGKGTFYVWLERHGGGWRVAAAISEVRRTG
jgi:hypothetical protein